MSDQIARAHTSQSKRARARDAADRKAVYKAVVENPFRVQWPSVPANIQNAILASVVDMLGGVAEHNINREEASRRKRHAHACREHTRKKAKHERVAMQENNTALVDIPGTSTTAMEVENGDHGSMARPSILQSMTVGINEVTRALEALARSHRAPVRANSNLKQGTALVDLPLSNHSRLVIACRGDVDPSILIGHLPNLIAACNSARKGAGSSSGSGETWLLPMPKGAEHTLSEAMGFRRVSVLLIESSAPQFSTLASLLQSVPLLIAPWFAPPAAERPVKLVPTHIKQLRTSAPKDMKAAKEKRLAERSAAKERRRLIPRRLTVSSPVGQPET